VPKRRWRLLSPGPLVAAVVWIAVSAAFAFYSSSFGSYNKTWGSLSAVIVMLTWLWLSALALLLGAEIDALREQPQLASQPAPQPRRSAVPLERARHPAPR